MTSKKHNPVSDLLDLLLAVAQEAVAELSMFDPVKAEALSKKLVERTAFLLVEALKEGKG